MTVWQRASLTYPEGTVIDFGYTARQQVATITAGGPPPLATYTYDLAGQRVSKTLENGTVSTSHYDAANRLTALEETRQGASWNRLEYTLDTLGQRTARRESGPGFSTTESYLYDALEQVTGVRSESSLAATAPVSRAVDYSYDAAGNRQSVTETSPQTQGQPVTTSYLANALNQYTAIDHLAPPGYDLNGNLTQVQYHLGAGAWSYQYDAQNRLIGGSNGTHAFRFAYDPYNRCVTRTIDGVTTANFYDGWSLIEERDPSDRLLARLIHGAFLDELLVRTTPQGNVYYHQDGLGSTVALSDPSGQVLERYQYDVYGNVTVTDPSGTPLASSQSPSGNRFLFTGREWFADLEISDHRHRYYTPNQGRWLSADPIGEAGGINLYGYVLNEPVLLTDSLGLDTQQYSLNMSIGPFTFSFGVGMDSNGASGLQFSHGKQPGTGDFGVSAQLCVTDTNAQHLTDTEGPGNSFTAELGDVLGVFGGKAWGSNYSGATYGGGFTLGPTPVGANYGGSKQSTFYFNK